MHPQFLDILRCPQTGEPLRLEIHEGDANGMVRSGFLHSSTRSYPIVRGVPRFVDEQVYAASFGFEWARWPRVQFESENIGGPMEGHTTRMWERITGPDPRVAGRTIVDFGCGPGRFIDIVRRKGGRAVGIDLSNAVDAARNNFANDPDVLIVQADLLRPPFAEECFDGGFSIGVLHHTPDPAAGIASLVKTVRPDGWVACCVYPKGDFYDYPSVRRFRRLHLALRNLIGYRFALGYATFAAYILAPLLRPLKRIGLNDAVRYVERYWLVSLWLKDGRWRLLDVFDAITPEIASTHTAEEVHRWLRDAGCDDTVTTPWCANVRGSRSKICGTTGTDFLRGVRKTYMRILVAVARNYYGQPHALEPMFLEFTEPLRGMGHTVDHFDHVNTWAEQGPAICAAIFQEKVRDGNYDLVFYQTAGRDYMDRDAIRDASRRVPVIAWNSDDDWQWESYTSQVAPLFTFMITTYPDVYERGRRQHANLLLSQWGCLETYANFTAAKDLDFTFVGQIYRNRVAEMRYLRRHAGLKVYGLGALRVSCPPFNSKRFREMMGKLIPATNRALAFPEVHAIWNRTKVSYTPLGASKDRGMLQIKGRLFHMGLSGTMMLVRRSSQIERYYEPGKEYVPFDDLDDCIAKATYYINQESERARIAAAYAARTRAEHLWPHRFERIFRDIGIASLAARKVA